MAKHRKKISHTIKKSGFFSFSGTSSYTIWTWKSTKEIELGECINGTGVFLPILTSTQIFYPCNTFILPTTNTISFTNQNSTENDLPLTTVLTTPYNISSKLNKYLPTTTDISPTTSTISFTHQTSPKYLPTRANNIYLPAITPTLAIKMIPSYLTNNNAVLPTNIREFKQSLSCCTLICSWDILCRGINTWRSCLLDWLFLFRQFWAPPTFSTCKRLS